MLDSNQCRCKDGGCEIDRNEWRGVDTERQRRPSSARRSWVHISSRSQAKLAPCIGYLYMPHRILVSTAYSTSERDSAGLMNQNNELKFRLQAMEQQAQLRDGTLLKYLVDAVEVFKES